jgi:hypothetical protein
MKKIFILFAAVLFSAQIFGAGHVPATTHINATCNGICNGSANGSVTGGIGPFGYSWAGPASYSGSGTAISGLCAGTYTLTVTDSSDMSAATATAVITQPTPVAVTATSPIICAGSTANLNASATGGTGPYTYNWNCCVSDIHIPDPTASPVVTTSYTVTATDSYGCIGFAVTTVTVAPLPAVAVNSPTICAGQTAMLTASGATTYLWNTGAISMPYSVTPATTTSYTVTGTSGGCSNTAVSMVTVNPNPTVSVVPSSTGCALCNGSIATTASGGTTFSWSGPSGYSATIMNPTNLCAGTYTVIASAMGCTSSPLTTVINTSTSPTATSSVTNATCGMCDGSATITVTGGTGPYTFLWSPSMVTTATATALCAGTYMATITDAGGCSYNLNVTINNTTGPTAASITTVNSGCVTASGELHISGITGGVIPYSFSINGGPFTANVDYYGLGAGTYYVDIKDANGCIHSEVASVNLLNPPVITLDSLNGIACSSGILGNIFISVTGGTPGYTYSWSNGSTVQDQTGLTLAANYTVTVTDAAGCSAANFYYIGTTSTLYGTVSTTSANCGTLGTATVIVGGGIAPYTYAWSTVPVQSTQTATGLTGGLYHCTFTDAVGCMGTVYANVANGCYNTIKGRIYADTNSNCIQDSWEQGISGRIVVASPGGYYGSTDVNGDYTILTPNMNNTVNVSSFPGHILTCPVSGTLNVNFTTLGDTISANNFGYHQNLSSFDLGIHPGWTSSNPGFPKTYWFLYWNYAAGPQNALVRFVYDSVLQYTGCTAGGVHYPAQHKIEWSFPSLPPGVYWDWASRPQAFFNVPATLSTSTMLQTYFEILPIAGDLNPVDNTLNVLDPVTGCRDPNSKSVIPKGTGPGGDILATDSVLFYTIHFQNDGNDTAHFVIVKDTLSPFLDPSTIIPGAADHPYTFDLSGTGVATFTFNNIMLPDSTTDEPASSGYFNYTIKQRANNPAGTVINNKASIYFDFNEGVVTNTTINTIVDVATGLQTSSSNNSVKAYPNPFTEQTTFVIQSDKLNETYSFEMTDVLGKKVKGLTGISSRQFEISRNGLENGIYFYKIYTSESLVGIGKLVIR